MTRAMLIKVSDVVASKKFIILSPQKNCDITPLATVNLPKARNNVLHPIISPKLMGKSKRTARRKYPKFSIDSGDNENVDNKSKVKTVAKKRCGRKKKINAAGLDLPKLLSPPKTSSFSIAAEQGIPSHFVPQLSSTNDRVMRCSLLIKNALQMCQESSTHSSSPHVGLRNSHKVKALHQTDLLASRDYRTAAYRKIDFNNCTVISSEIPLNSTSTIDSDEENDIFKPPYFKSVPINIFEPVTIKHEKLEDYNEGTIFNEDVLINSNSTSVSTLTKYERDWHLDQNKLNIAQLYNPGLSVNQHPKAEKDLDDRVETLRIINSVSSINLGSDPAPDPIEIKKETISNVKDSEDTLDAKRNNIDELSSKVIEANETNIAGEGEANENTSDINHLDMKNASTPQDKVQKSLLENLDLQIKLLEDLVYGKASEAISTETHDSSNETENQPNVSEPVETNAGQAETKSDSSTTSQVQFPNDITQSEMVVDMVTSSGSPLESVALKEDLNIVNGDSFVKSGDLIVSTSVASEVEVNRETLANIPQQPLDDDMKSEEMIEIISNDPFANTFGKPDEVVISETVDTDNAELVEELQPVSISSEKAGEEEVRPSSDNKKEQTDLTEVNNVPDEMIETDIHERICEIIKEETDKLELSTDELSSALSDDEKVQVIESIGKETKKKIAALQRIVSFFNDVIDQNMSSTSTRAISEIGFVETLIHSTLNFYTICRNRPKKRKSLRCQRIKKLMSRSLYKFNIFSGQNELGEKDISVMSNDESLKTLKQLIEEAEKLSQNNTTTSQMKDDSGKERDIVEHSRNEESENAEVNDINNEKTVNIDIANVKFEDLLQCNMPHDYNSNTEIQIIAEFSSEEPFDSNSQVERIFLDEEGHTTEESDVNKEIPNLEKAGYMEPLLFSEVEDIISIPTKVSVSESNEVDASSASNTFANDESMHREPHSLKKFDSLRTYSRKRSNHITEKTVKKLSGDERNILEIGEPTRRWKKVENIDEPTKLVRATRSRKVDKIEEEIYNFDDPEWPIRRISKRIKKQPNFYGCPCGAENKKPKIQKTTKD